MTSTCISSTEFGSVNKINSSTLGDVLVLEHPNFQAKISLHGGQVLAWQPQNQRPVFWLSETSRIADGHAIRGGIPICWPWFGPHPKKPNIVKHGFARNQLWKVDSTAIDNQSITVVLVLNGENEHALWPETFTLKQTLVFSKQFKQTLTMTNLSDHNVQCSAALHSYFSVGDPEHVMIDDLSTTAFYDQLSSKDVASQPLSNCVGPIDRIYYSNKTMKLVDAKWQRTLEITSSNCQQWVLWNPGQAGAEAMPDVHNNGEKEFVCLEAANTEWHEVLPKVSVSIGQTIAIC